MKYLLLLTIPLALVFSVSASADVCPSGAVTQVACDPAPVDPPPSAPPPAPPPSPTPPPPSSLPTELTCCASQGSTVDSPGEEESVAAARAAGVVVPLDFGSGATVNKCWRSNGKEYRSQGIWPYHRGVRLITHWCAVKGVKIVGSNVVVDPYVSGGGRCSITNSSKVVVAGGNGYHGVVWQGKANFKCVVPLPPPFNYLFGDINLDQWVQGVYYDLGGHFVYRTGGS